MNKFKKKKKNLYKNYTKIKISASISSFKNKALYM